MRIEDYIKEVGREDVAMLRACAVVSRHSDDISTRNGAILNNPIQNLYYCAANVFPKGVSVNQGEEKLMRITHAERKVLFDAFKSGATYDFMRESTLYCPFAACSDCANAIIEFGVKRLVTHVSTLDPKSKWYKGCIVGYNCLVESGVELVIASNKLNISMLRRASYIRI